MNEPEAEHPLASAHELAGIHVRRPPASGLAEVDQSAKGRERGQRVREHLATGHLEDHVHAVAAVGLAQRCGQVVCAGVDCDVGTQAQRQRALVLRRRHADHPAGTEALCQLHRQRAHPARGGVHRHALAPAQLGARAQQVPGSRSLKDQGERVGAADPLGDRPVRAGVHDGAFRIAAPGHQRHHASPVAQGAHNLPAGDHRQGGLGQVGVLGLVGVGVVDPSGAHLHHFGPRRRLGLVYLVQLEHLGSAELLDLDGPHSSTKRSTCSSESAPPKE